MQKSRDDQISLAARADCLMHCLRPSRALVRDHVRRLHHHAHAGPAAHRDLQHLALFRPSRWPGARTARRQHACAQNRCSAAAGVRPDLVLLNEFDFDPQQRAADLFQQRYLEVAQPNGGSAALSAHRLHQHPQRHTVPATAHGAQRTGNERHPPLRTAPGLLHHRRGGGAWASRAWHPLSGMVETHVSNDAQALDAGLHRGRVGKILQNNGQITEAHGQRHARRWRPCARRQRPLTG